MSKPSCRKVKYYNIDQFLINNFLGFFPYFHFLPPICGVAGADYISFFNFSVFLKFFFFMECWFSEKFLTNFIESQSFAGEFDMSVLSNTPPPPPPPCIQKCKTENHFQVEKFLRYREQVILGFNIWWTTNAAACTGGRDGTRLLPSVSFQGGAGEILLVGHFPIPS